MNGKTETCSIFGFVVTWCMVSKQSLHLSLSPFLVSPFVSCRQNVRSLKESILHICSMHNETTAI